MSQREIVRTIPANSGQDIGATGDFVYLHTANLPLLVQVAGQTVTMRAGDKRRVAEGFVFFRVENENASDVNAVFIVGRGDYSRQAVTGEVTLTTPATIASTADVSLAATATTQIKAANTDRREIIISNLSTNTQTMRIGESSAGASRGVELAPGASITLQTTAAVYGYNPGGSAESVGVLEVVS